MAYLSSAGASEFKVWHSPGSDLTSYHARAAALKFSSYNRHNQKAGQNFPCLWLKDARDGVRTEKSK